MAGKALHGIGAASTTCRCARVIYRVPKRIPRIALSSNENPTMQTSLQIDTPDGAFRAHVVRPAGNAPAPAVVVLHEVFGVNADMRMTCDELAAQGYVAICPDLLWRLEPGVELSDRTPAELDKAMALYAAFDLDTGVRDAARTLDFARSLPGTTGRVGMLGFCLGGLMSFLASARAGADAAVAYYPGNADRHLADAPNIATPLLVHLAQEDEYIPKPAQRQIVEALNGRPTVQIRSYAGCNHAFARHSGSHYDAAAAALANGRSAAFLARHLRREAPGTMPRWPT
jgi:carboxymethylenebutenolidase